MKIRLGITTLTHTLFRTIYRAITFKIYSINYQYFLNTKMLCIARSCISLRKRMSSINCQKHKEITHYSILFWKVYKINCKLFVTDYIGVKQIEKLEKFSKSQIMTSLVSIKYYFWAPLVRIIFLQYSLKKRNPQFIVQKIY